jgi:hypothetical protein
VELFVNFSFLVPYPVFDRHVHHLEGRLFQKSKRLPIHGQLLFPRVRYITFAQLRTTYSLHETHRYPS